MKKIAFCVYCLVTVLFSQAQPQLTVEQNLEDYDFTVKYIEDNYSGIPTKVVDSALADYDAMKIRLRAQVAQGERPGWNAAAEYMAWFNDKHLSIHEYYTNDEGERINWTEHYLKKKDIHYEAVMDYRPTAVACKVTNKTFLIRLPSCGGNPDMKWILNSVKQFKKSKCKYLVIDIRGNGGGADSFFRPYLNLLWNHEAVSRNREWRNTPQNIDYLQRDEDYGPIASYLIGLSSQRPNDEFIGGEYDLIRCKKVDKSVKKAALIIDNKVASSGEGMVLDVKATSNRTAVYGRDNSKGCLDYQNVAIIPFKHYNRTFQMPMSRNSNLPEGAIDETGIVPDVRIPLPLPAKLTDDIDEWVIWVANQLEAE